MPKELYTNKEYQSILLRTLGEPPKLRIIDFFMDNPLSDSTKREVIDALGMNKQTFYKYFADVKEYGIVSATIKIGRATLYKTNPRHPLVSMLREYETKVSLQIAEQEKARMKKPVVVRKELDLESSLGS